MKLTKKVKSISLLVFIALCITACSRGPVIQDFSEDTNPNDEYVKLDKDLNEAYDNQINILSPYNFNRAEKSLREAKKSLDKKENAKTTLHLIAEGRAYFNRSVEFAKLSQVNLKEVIVARQQAVIAGARNLYSKDFRHADESFEDVTSEIERSEIDNAIEKKNVLQRDYLDLELRAIKQANLGQARATIAQAIKEGAKENAPKSLALAEKNVQDLDTLITTNRHDVYQIQARVAEVQKSADHVLKITRIVKSEKKISSEEVALRMESEQEKLDNKQAQLRDKDFQLTKKQKELVQNQHTIRTLAAKNMNLESEQEFNRRYEEARRQFSASEADVYKQGKVLMIRLKGLEFPASEATLTSSGLEILAKVQKVLKSFGKSSVTIEGHTDSVGGRSLNQKLSVDRARAVRDYLLANGAGEVTEVKAVGYDYQKPLATNKTPVGRAKNRRVDVLINPETSENDIVR